MSDLLSLDEVDDDVSEALKKDVEDVNEAERIVEEQIDEDIERAQQEADEDREEENQEEEDAEQDEKDLEEVQDSLEFYSFVGSDPVSKLMIKKHVERFVWRRGCRYPSAALEAFDNGDVEGLKDFVAEQRNKVEKSQEDIAQERNRRRLRAWKKVLHSVERLIGLIRSNQDNVSDLDSLGSMALRWEPLGDLNRKDFEMLTDTHGHWVEDVISTLSTTRHSVKAMVEVIEAEMAFYAQVEEDPASSPGYTHFLSDIKRGEECLFKSPLIGAFNLRINPVVDHGSHPHTYAGAPTSTVGEITVSSSVGGVSEQALGDRRELEDLQALTLSILKTSKIASKAFVRLYSGDLDYDAPCVSIHLVIRMLKLLIALRRTLSLDADQTKHD